MNAYDREDRLRRRVRQLEQQNDFLAYQNDLLNEAVETICGAFLNNPRDLDTAIQTALTLQQRARQHPDRGIQSAPRERDLEID